jgi:LPS-assembly lipoprotein
MTLFPRRSALAALGLLSLARCGFHPLYARGDHWASAPARQELERVGIVLLHDRPGQLLQQALESKFGGASPSYQKRYMLSVDYSVPGEGIGIRSDYSPSHTRLIGRANWVLRANDPANTELVKGSAHLVDGTNNFDSQPFAGDLENEVVQARLADAIADQITYQLAAYFDKKAREATQ